MLQPQTAPEVVSDCQRLADFTSHDAKEMAKALENVAAWDCRAPNICWSMGASASGSPGPSVEHPPLARGEQRQESVFASQMPFVVLV